jgi:hypothetical protein
MREEARAQFRKPAFDSVDVAPNLQLQNLRRRFHSGQLAFIRLVLHRNGLYGNTRFKGGSEFGGKIGVP